MSNPMLNDKIALVTGASRGIGRAIAVGLAKDGAHVIATARTQGGLEELDDEIKAAGGKCTLVPLDQMDPEGIEKLSEIIDERWGRLDILVAAAGQLGELTPAYQVTAKTWNEVMGVNAIAPARLIRAFEPLLLKSEAGRAVFLTSGASKSCRAYWAPYAASKAALDALVMSWADEHNSSDLRINLVNPGPMRTAMRKKAFPSEDRDALPPPEALVPLVLSLVSQDNTRHREWISFPDEG
jgi:NAD(P)-dependent dehydrogenase (short-subunit alcohol dehydrogenase family)